MGVLHEELEPFIMDLNTHVPRKAEEHPREGKIALQVATPHPMTQSYCTNVPGDPASAF